MNKTKLKNVPVPGELFQGSVELAGISAPVVTDPVVTDPVVTDPVVTDPVEFLRDLALDEEILPYSEKYSKSFPLRVTRSYIKKMSRGNLKDPLLIQVFPSAAEEHIHPYFLKDPVNDRGSIISPGLLRKYSGRALLLLGSLCPVHCRFCFRRHINNSGTGIDSESLEKAIGIIKSDQSISEVILSGGEPLLSPSKILDFLKTSMEGISHIKRLRIHTRLPSVSPERFKYVSLASLLPENKPALFVIHVNHPNEIDSGFSACVKKIRDTGASVLSQTVLLKGVNSSVKILSDLFTDLVNLNVLPYYLHQLDMVEGSSHFLVDENTGVSIMAELRKILPGYAVPRYVREVPESPCKVPVV